MGAPNVYDTSYVNSGPGVGMSAGSNSGTFSKGSGAYSGYSTNSNSILDNFARIAGNMANTSTSQYAQTIRDQMRNPYSSAKSAMDYEDYLGDFGSNYDMQDYYDMLMDMAEYNNNWSASQAEKQMQFQKASNYYAYKHNHDEASRQMQFQNAQNKYAMNWSAQEAQKSREWTEKLSNTAHRREVQDLLSAGLNPILSANGGAYSGSGATGQAFSGSGSSGSAPSSSGAMGQTDMSVTGALAGLFSGVMTTARDLAVTKMGVDAQKYHTDMQYAMSKMSTEASIYNNNNTVSAQKAIAQLNREADLQKANISASAQRYSAGVSAGAMQSAAATNAAAARYSADKHLEASKYSSDNSYAGTMYSSDSNKESSKYSTDKSYDEKMYQHTHNITNPVAMGASYADEYPIQKLLGNIADMAGAILDPLVPKMPQY